MSLRARRVDELTRRVESIRKVDFGQDFDFDQFDLQVYYGNLDIYVNGSLMAIGVGVWGSASGLCFRGSVRQLQGELSSLY